MKKSDIKPSLKCKGAELYTRVGKPDIKIMNEKFITDNTDLQIWVERSNWWYIFVDGMFFEKTKTLKQSQFVTQNLIKHDIV